MRFALTHPLLSAEPDLRLADPDGLAQVAAAAETAGFSGFGVTDHPAPSREWLAAGGHRALDPFVALTWAAAHTTDIRLITNLLVLPYRNPFLVASAAATLDRLSGGRLTLTLGTGYLEAEFAALGVDHAERNVRFDESLSIMRQCWSGDPVNASSDALHASDVVSWPTPVQSGGPRLWIGGNSALARRRSASTSGWAPFPAGRGMASATRTAPLTQPGDVGQHLDAIASARADLGLATEPFDVAFALARHAPPGSPDFDPGSYLDGIGGLSAAGINWCWVHIPGESIEAACEAIEGFGAEVITPHSADQQA